MNANDATLSTETNPEFASKVKILCRQTTLSEIEAAVLIEKHEGDLEKCLDDFFNIKPEPPKPLSTNQAIYKCLRELY